MMKMFKTKHILIFLIVVFIVINFLGLDAWLGGTQIKEEEVWMHGLRIITPKDVELINELESYKAYCKSIVVIAKYYDLAFILTLIGILTIKIRNKAVNLS